MVLHRARRPGMVMAAASLVLGVIAAPSIRGEEPGRLGRLFRIGAPSRGRAFLRGEAKAGEKPDVRRDLSAPPRRSLPLYPGSPDPPAPPLSGATESAGSRIKPQPRVNRAITEAEPLVTRISIGRTDDGKQFCMFVQIFADGTVLDSDGVHRVGPSTCGPSPRSSSRANWPSSRGTAGVLRPTSSSRSTSSPTTTTAAGYEPPRSPTPGIPRAVIPRSAR